MTQRSMGLFQEKQPLEAMMMNSLHASYSSPASKTEQILSRYRPIAPKPMNGPTTPENAQQSPFMKHLQARPSRSRKRGRYGCSPAKRTRHTLLPSVCGIASLAQNTRTGLSLQGFGQGFLPQFPQPSPGLTASLEKPVNLVTLPFLPYPSSASEVPRSVSELSCMNAYSHLEEVMELTNRTNVPQEKDLLQKLQAGGADSRPAKIVTPKPVRPVGSSISVGFIDENISINPTHCVAKKPEEIEAEMESETLPALVSDSKNRVRMANSAYKEMVGQPVCLWLDSMITYDELLRGNACKRISGKVKLDLSDLRMPISSNAFTCKAKIEWGSNEKKSSVDVACDVVKICCESKDYLFRWRFHTSKAASESNLRA